MASDTTGDGGGAIDDDDGTSIPQLGAAVMSILDIVVVHGNGAIFAVATAGGAAIVLHAAGGVASGGTRGRATSSRIGRLLSGGGRVEGLDGILDDFAGKLAMRSRFLMVRFDILLLLLRNYGLTLGWMGKQHQRMKAMKATSVPTSSIKSSMVYKGIYFTL